MTFRDEFIFFATFMVATIYFLRHLGLRHLFFATFRVATFRDGVATFRVDLRHLGMVLRRLWLFATFMAVCDV